jgi:hypothetical protein
MRPFAALAQGLVAVKATIIMASIYRNKNVNSFRSQEEEFAEFDPE